MDDYIFNSVTKYGVKLVIESCDEYPRTYSITMEKNGVLLYEIVALSPTNDEYTNKEIVKLTLSHLAYRLDEEIARKEQ